MVARPAYLPKPFADLTVDKNVIPENPPPGLPGNASLDTGFPPITKLPSTSGGLPPLQEDFNGAFNQLYQFAQWQQTGGQALWDVRVDEYPVNTILFGSDGIRYQCIQINGSSTTTQDPVTDVSRLFWKLLSGEQDFVVNTFDDLGLLPSGRSAKVLGYRIFGDGGGGPDRVFMSGAAPGTYVNDGGSTRLPNGGDGSSAWIFAETKHITIREFGARTTTSSENSEAIQSAFNWSSLTGNAIYGIPGFVNCLSQIIIKSNLNYIGHVDGRIVKNYNSTGGVIDALIRNETYGYDLLHDTNISLINLRLGEAAANTQSSLITINWVDGLTINDMDLEKQTSQGWTAHINGRNVIMDGVNIDSSNASQFGDGIHFEYLENAVLDNFIIFSEDDSVAIQPQPKSNASAGPNKTTRNVTGSNWTLSSTDANGIRIGAGELNNIPNSNDVNPLAYHDGIEITGVTIEKLGVSGTALQLYDERTNLATSHRNISINDVFVRDDVSVAESVRIKGNINVLDPANINIKNFRDVTLNNINVSQNSAGAFIDAGGIEEITIDGSRFRQFATNSNGTLLRMINTINIYSSTFFVDSSGNGIVMQDFENINIYDSRVKGTTAESAAYLLSQITKTGGSVHISGGSVADVERTVSKNGTYTLDSMVIDGLLEVNVSLSEGVPTSLQDAVFLVNNTLLNTIYRQGANGGAGTAGAGNQYIPVKLGANIYKVLHDGTV